MTSVKQKLNVKSLDEKCQALRDLEKSPQIKTLVKNMIYFVVKLSFIEITNALNILQNLCPFHEVGNEMLELLQRFQSLYVDDAARRQSSILTFSN